MAPRKLHTS